MRRLRRADRRRRRALVRDPDRGLHRARHRDARRSRHAGASRSGAAGLHLRTGRAMRLLPQRHDHRDQGIVDAFPSPDRDRSAGSVAPSAVPLRRPYRNHARGNARCRPRRRGAGVMAAPDTTGERERPQGTLTVVRSASPVEAVKFETFIRITADGSVTAYNGHVDLGTGIRTALGQIVAEELDVSFARIVVVLGDTSLVPNQGATIASETIQKSAEPLRYAAAQARHFLIARAAGLFGEPLEDLSVEDGLIRGKYNRSVSYGELIAGEIIRLALDENVPVKAVNAYTIVGQSVPRID